MNNYMAVGNDELGNKVAIGDTITNVKTGERITITEENYGKNAETGERTELILAYEKEGSTYLIGVAGQLIHPWEKV